MKINPPKAVIARVNAAQKAQIKAAAVINKAAAVEALKSKEKIAEQADWIISLEECDPLSWQNSAYIINLLLYPESAKLLMEDGAYRLKIICAEYTGNYPQGLRYYSNSMQCVLRFAFNSDKGGIFCYNCLQKKGDSSYGNFLLSKCNDCHKENKAGWPIVQEYFLDVIARAFLQPPAVVIDFLCAGILVRENIRKQST